MLANRKLIIDTMSEVYGLLKPWVDDEFWDFDLHRSRPGSTYLFGRQQFFAHKRRIIDMALSGEYTVVFCNAAEGSWTLQTQVQMLGIEQLVIDRKILLISGGEQQTDYSYVQYDHFLVEILKYEENVQTTNRTNEIFARKSKPYKFLFLNGRARPHRKYLYERFRQLGILEQSLWTMLDSKPCISENFVLRADGKNLMATNSEVRCLPTQYEVPLYKDNKIKLEPDNGTFVKSKLFNNTWGEIYLQAEPYIDTYFSLVTETVVEQPWPFRTEKIAKPLMIGHPFIVATSPGYYQDLHRLGFQTFGNLIDESFDKIDNHRDRMERIVAIVQDLCQQDLDSFVEACEPVCKYNQQHLQEISPKIQSNFPDQFVKLLNL
jgi:hypothetical protein